MVTGMTCPSVFGPSLLDSLQVGDDNVHKYDWYALGYEKDVATVDTSSNKGFGILAKLG